MNINNPCPFKTLIEIVQWRAIHQPNQLAYLFLPEGESEVISITYQQLDTEVKRVAGLLQSHAVAGETALLLYPQGLVYIIAFLACLYTGVIAIPTYPPHRNRPDKRIQAIVANADPHFILATQEILSDLQPRLSNFPELENRQWLSTDDLKSSDAIYQLPEIHPEMLAFLQYTSGSTGVPKGVMISHSNLMQNSEYIRTAFQLSADSVSVTWLPSFHDMGLIDGIIQPLYTGFLGIIMPSVAFLQKPIRWLQAITHYRATHCGGPNFGFDLCVNKIAPEELAQLDLSSWKSAYNGAEPVRQMTLTAFAERFQACGFQANFFYPCYGMAESTLMISGGELSQQPIYKSFDADNLEEHKVVELPSSLSSAEVRTLVGCGHAWLDTQIKIVNPETFQTCAPNEVGEIWVSGESIAQGYWNNPQATEQTFHAYLADTREGPFLRTGDLGFLQDNELFITGRLKDVIIIRGRNYYPQDIELTIENSHPALLPNCSAAFSIELYDEERLVVAVELERRYRQRRRQPPPSLTHDRRHLQDRRQMPENYDDNLSKPLDLQEIITAIRQAVSQEHELQVYAVLLLRVGSIPKTTSGKIQRHACRDGFLKGSLNVVSSDLLQTVNVHTSHSPLSRDVLLEAPETKRQALLNTYLHELVAEVLKISHHYFDWQHTLNGLGMDSLMAVQLQHRLQTELGIVLPMAKFLQGESIAQLATDAFNQLNESLPSNKEKPTTQQTISESEQTIPLSHNQQALWFLQQLAPESAAYNVSFAVKIHSEVEVTALQRTFEQLVMRHPTLRTTYTQVAGKPVQQIHQHPRLDFHYLDASQWSISQIKTYLIEEAYRPFDLENGAMLRIYLATRSATEHYLLLVIHHIATDLWSMLIMMDELRTIYPAEKAGIPINIPALSISYTDFVQWQQTFLASQTGKQQWQYWQQKLSGELPILNLPTDYPRPPVQTYVGGSHPFKIEAHLTKAIKAYIKQPGITLYTFLLTVFQVLLYRYTNQEDIIVGSVASGRSRAEFDSIIGYVANAIALRGDLSGNPTFADFLHQMRQTVLEALTHQDYPFQLLVDQLLQERDPSRSPIFQVMFVVQKPHRLPESAPFVLKEAGAKMELGGLQLESIALEQRIAQFDMTLTFIETEDESLLASWEYNANLFAPETIARMAAHYQKLLVGIIENPQTTLMELPLITDAEKNKILYEWNNIQIDYPKDVCVHQLFEQQVEKTPDAIAVVFEQQQLTYRELNEKANQLAHYLRMLGVESEVLVGICVERSLKMIIGLLGVIKAGGAYVPLDPIHPANRLRFILEDAQLSILLTQESMAHKFTEFSNKVIYLDTQWPEISQQSIALPIDVKVDKDNPIYVIYTSGSTGNPKGCLITHGNVTRLFTATEDWFNFNEKDVWTLFHSYAFDFAVWEMWGALIYGGKLIVIPYEKTRSPEEFYNLLIKEQVSILNQTPSAFQQLIRAAQTRQGNNHLNLRYVIFGGETLDPQTLIPWFELHGETHPQLINMYGITETTVHVTYRPLKLADAHLKKSVIGQPIPDLEVYILNEYSQLNPINILGEMYIGGAGVARGYLNRPELTAERFIKNPFRNDVQDRLYKTGDLARYLPNGDIEYLGRIDHQVKIRGFRIELGEIETVLNQHATIQETVVIAWEDDSENKRLVAYVVPKALTETIVDSEKETQEQVNHWKTLYEQVYTETAGQQDIAFNIIGWNSSYTEQPIPNEEMREWLTQTIAGIKQLNPQNVLEIGCGTGLLLTQLAPQCNRYVGIDFSQQALDYIRFLQEKLPNLAHAELFQRSAEELADFPSAHFDTIIINSVIQYFPNVDYLQQVLINAIQLVKPGGYIFIGDIRNYILLNTYHTSVQLYQAPKHLPLSQLQQRIQQRVSLEEELLIDPAFFLALQQHYSQINHVQIKPKQGQYHNELTRFRYEAILHIGTSVQPSHLTDWLNWQTAKLTLSTLRQQLTQQQPRQLGIRNIPNPRLQTEYYFKQWASENADNMTLESFTQFLSQQPTIGIEPDIIWTLTEELPYHVEISWLNTTSLGDYDVVFTHNSQSYQPAIFKEDNQLKAWQYYANNPLQGKLTRQLVPQLRQFLQEKLPDYMIPAAFIVLDAFPLTPNGKIDHKALPVPELIRQNWQQFTKPRGITETTLAKIWQELLGFPQISVHDNFFELGGHSLLATQLVSRIRDSFGLELPVKHIFESPTIAELAKLIDVKQIEEINPDELETLLAEVEGLSPEALQQQPKKI